MKETTTTYFPQIADIYQAAKTIGRVAKAVSYTHLTLPTIA